MVFRPSFDVCPTNANIETIKSFLKMMVNVFLYSLFNDCFEAGMKYSAKNEKSREKNIYRVPNIRVVNQ
jgi:hypothetical protein